VPALDAVVEAVEMACLAQEGWEEVPGALQEARALLSDPEADPMRIPGQLGAAAQRWSRRSEAARQLYASWEETLSRGPARELLAASTPSADLSRMLLLLRCGEALQGSVHLPTSQALGLVAGCADAPHASEALRIAGEALEAFAPRTSLGRAYQLRWRELLAVARVPAPLALNGLPAGRGMSLQDPLAPLLRLEEDGILLRSRELLSWSAGALVADAGPPQTRLTEWDSVAWRRLCAIAMRRSELTMAGVIRLQTTPTGERHEPAPLLAVPRGTSLLRLNELLSWLEGEGTERVCLLLNADSVGVERAACFSFRQEVAPQEAMRLVPGGLQAMTRAGLGSSDASWAVPGNDARIEDLVLALDEARHAGRPLGLAAALCWEPDAGKAQAQD